MTQFMGCLGNCVNAIDRGMELRKLCKKIRKELGQYKCRKNQSPWETDIRKRDLYNDGRFIGTMSSKATTINEDFEELSNQYREALAEKDETEFIRKCADLHFDFTRVHPFIDGNGRTSRILLSMMLATRNYMLPSLYTTIKEKDIFYKNSNAALHGDYSIIENAIFERLGHFHPLVMPRTKKEQQEVARQLSKNCIGMEDLKIISNGADAQEIMDVIRVIKNLKDKAEQKDKEALTEQEQEEK